MDLDRLRVLNANTLTDMQNLHTINWFTELDVGAARKAGKYLGEMFFVGDENMHSSNTDAAWVNGHLPNSETTRGILRTKQLWASKDTAQPASLLYHDPDKGIHPGMVWWDLSGRLAGVSGWRGLVDHIKACTLGVFAGHMSEEAAERLLDPTKTHLAMLLATERIPIDGDYGYREMVDYIEKSIVSASKTLKT